MTTIACTRDAMACDSRVTVGDVTHPGQKVWVAHGMIIGVCGEGRAMSSVLKWLLAGRPAVLPDPEKGAAGYLLLTTGGIFTCDETCFIEPVKRSFHAIGSGAGPAIAAMMCGKSASEAVQIACDVDGNSGGPVRVYKLADVKQPTTTKRKA